MLDKYQRLTNSIVQRVNETRGLNRSMREAIAPKKTQQSFLDGCQRAVAVQLTAGILTEASIRLQHETLLTVQADTPLEQTALDHLQIVAPKMLTPTQQSSLPQHIDWHRTVYATLPTINAVLLSQPTAALAWAAYPIRLDPELLHNAHEITGRIVCVKADELSAEIQPNRTLVVAGVGILSWGIDIAQAISRAHILDRWCDIALRTYQSTQSKLQL